jgi:Flp pilus assembly protein TadB
MSLHEIAEHIEHAAHGSGGGHGGSGVARYIGITMALLGVMVAFCSAMVGAQRTELIKALVEQSTRMGTYQTETMKFRAMTANSELLKALSPAQDEIKKIETTLREKRRASGKGDDEDTAELKDLISSSVEDLADLLTPDHEVIRDFGRVAKTYERDMKEAKEDADSYDKMIEARGEAAEGYERALLAAEIGIVIASVALLLGNRMVWAVSLVLAVTCIGTAGYTFQAARHNVAAAQDKIQKASDNVIQLEKDDETE